MLPLQAKIIIFLGQKLSMNGPNFSGKLVLQNIPVLRKKLLVMGGSFQVDCGLKRKLDQGLRKKTEKGEKVPEDWSTRRRRRPVESPTLLLLLERRPQGWVLFGLALTENTFSVLLRSSSTFSVSVSPPKPRPMETPELEKLKYCRTLLSSSLSLSLTLSLMQTHTRTSTLFLTHSLSLYF